MKIRIGSRVADGLLMRARLSRAGALEIGALAYLATGQPLPCEAELETECPTMMTDAKGSMMIPARHPPRMLWWRRSDGRIWPVPSCSFRRK